MKEVITTEYMCEICGHLHDNKKFAIKCETKPLQKVSWVMPGLAVEPSKEYLEREPDTPSRGIIVGNVYHYPYDGKNSTWHTMAVSVQFSVGVNRWVAVDDIKPSYMVREDKAKAKSEKSAKKEVIKPTIEKPIGEVKNMTDAKKPFSDLATTEESKVVIKTVVDRYGVDHVEPIKKSPLRVKRKK
jgi:hypothetical protein